MKKKTKENKSSVRATRYALRDSAGFSFIEVILSVFLMSAGMVAAISLIGGGLKESLDSRNQIIASLLAQEGVELVRNIRDTNWVTTGNTSFSGFPASPATCRIDARSITSLTQCVGSESKVLRYDGTTRLYNHTGGSNTKFLRQITIDDSGSDKIITSMVIWKGSNFPSATGCTTGAGCSYAEATLTKWNE